MKRIEDIKVMLTGKKAAPKSRPPERDLPDPADLPLDMPLKDVFMRRRSSLDFSDATICDEDLVRILWAADGINGKGKNDNHRTTPTTLNWKEIDTYVVKANGVWLWVPERHVLSFVHEKDCRKDFCLLQPMVSQAPVHLVYVYDQAKTQGLMTDLAMQIVQFIKKKNITTLSEEVMAHAPLLDAGARVMAVYMACAALNLNCLARLTFDSQKVHDTLGLTATQKPLCVQTLGHKPKGLLDLAF